MHLNLILIGIFTTKHHSIVRIAYIFLPFIREIHTRCTHFWTLHSIQKWIAFSLSTIKRRSVSSSRQQFFAKLFPSALSFAASVQLGPKNSIHLRRQWYTLEQMKFQDDSGQNSCRCAPPLQTTLCPAAAADWWSVPNHSKSVLYRPEKTVGQQMVCEIKFKTQAVWRSSCFLRSAFKLFCPDWTKNRRQGRVLTRGCVFPFNESCWNSIL